MTETRTPDPLPASETAARSADTTLEALHWHIVRCDHLRAGVASRAGAVLSTNALVIAGTTLVLSLRDQKPDALLVAIALASLGCVAFSVGGAALALISLRSWRPQSRDQGTATSFLYCYVEADEVTNTFETFKHRALTASSDELLEFALVELWRCCRLYRYRYKRLRIAVCLLLAALVLFLAAAAVSALG
ncbi:hypothetical protein [Actinomadura decatromicini]|uniref:Pycsar effector protein domain-containing protein n=1 Tax=Actinomadura decatromicini TaxID=2604572 RepID=A0A5D3F7L6_9ACTN|nr:hypothetical protein [Actinomadura decatromicini]TYK44059.1 hypothetical protein FXF68_35695 [Actinomadura decatromicini]